MVGYDQERQVLPCWILVLLIVSVVYDLHARLLKRMVCNVTSDSQCVLSYEVSLDWHFNELRKCFIQVILTVVNLSK